jgi:hypothetical protein
MRLPVTLPKRSNVMPASGILFDNTDFSARDTDQDRLNWTAGLFAAQDSNIIGCAAGHYGFSIRASDGAAEVVNTFEVMVANTNQAPLILPMPRQLASEGDTLSFTTLGVDGDGDPLHLALIHDSTTPTGVYFDPKSGYLEWTRARTSSTTPRLPTHRSSSPSPPITERSGQSAPCKCACSTSTASRKSAAVTMRSWWAKPLACPCSLAQSSSLSLRPTPTLAKTLPLTPLPKTLELESAVCFA